jgi:hypothetical protein
MVLFREDALIAAAASETVVPPRLAGRRRGSCADHNVAGELALTIGITSSY